MVDQFKVNNLNVVWIFYMFIFHIRTQLEKAKEDKSNVFRGNRVTSLDELSKAVHTRIMVRFGRIIEQESILPNLFSL